MEQCPRNEIDQYVTYLTQKLQVNGIIDKTKVIDIILPLGYPHINPLSSQSETVESMKPTLIQACSFTSHPQAVRKLVQVVLKQVSGYDDVLLRILAITGLSKSYVTPEDYEYVSISNITLTFLFLIILIW